MYVDLQNFPFFDELCFETPFNLIKNSSEVKFKFPWQKIIYSLKNCEKENFSNYFVLSNGCFNDAK